MNGLDEIASKVRELAVENAGDSKFYLLAMQVYFLTLAVQEAQIDELDRRTSPLAGDPTKEDAKNG